MVRDPRDVVLSCYMQSFALNPAMANFHTLEGAVRLYDVVQHTWRSAASLMDASRIHVCRYEELAANPQPVIDALCQFLGLQPEEAMLHPEIASVEGVLTPSLRQIARPINTQSVERHRHYATYLQDFMGILRPWISHFGYPE